MRLFFSEGEVDDTLERCDHLRVGAAHYPPTHSREFPELGVTLSVYEGVVDVAVPVTPNAELFNWTNPEKPDQLKVPVSVLFQACSETICYVPRTEALSLTVPIEPLLTSGAPRAR